MNTETIDLKNLWTDGGETYKLAKRAIAEWGRGNPENKYTSLCCMDAYSDGYDEGLDAGYDECRNAVMRALD